jgi:opacity protein-like surface antigen
VQRDLKKQLRDVRRHGLDLGTVARNRISRAVKTQRLELARSTAQLEVAQLRASVDATLQNKVTQAEARVQNAEDDLAGAINSQLQQRLPTSVSADKTWTDPIIGARAQWNINDKWFLAGKGDIGGFGVGSDFAWNLQATVGYQFTETISAELGYRYYQTDYSDGGFVYDMAESGLYTGVNFRF